jgi:hypothetical protein
LAVAADRRLRRRIGRDPISSPRPRLRLLGRGRWSSRWDVRPASRVVCRIEAAGAPSPIHDSRCAADEEVWAAPRLVEPERCDPVAALMPYFGTTLHRSHGCNMHRYAELAFVAR